MEESLIEMYLAGVSVRRVEYVTELLWGPRVSASTVSNLNQKVYGRIARDPRRGGRREREQGMQEIVLEKLEGARPGWRSAVYLGHAPGLPRVRIGGLLGRQVTTLHSTLLQERVHEGREGNADLPRVPP